MEKKFRPVKIIIGELLGIPTEENNVVIPGNNVRIITENGQVWQAILPAFGLNHATAEQIFNEKFDKVFSKVIFQPEQTPAQKVVENIIERVTLFKNRARQNFKDAVAQYYSAIKYNFGQPD